jgi:hypothetical protein
MNRNERITIIASRWDWIIRPSFHRYRRRRARREEDFDLDLDLGLQVRWEVKEVVGVQVVVMDRVVVDSSRGVVG